MERGELLHSLGPMDPQCSTYFRVRLHVRLYQVRSHFPVAKVAGTTTKYSNYGSIKQRALKINVESMVRDALGVD
jgi:hypothetical protein